jgi:iron complex outermembrane receptor protein
MNLVLPILREKLLSGIEVQYMSKRKTIADKYADAFFVTNLTVFSQKLIRGLEISGSIYNLFDKKFANPGSMEHRQDTIEQMAGLFDSSLRSNFNF